VCLVFLAIKVQRVLKQLVRCGILLEDQGEKYLADDGDDSEEAPTLMPGARRARLPAGRCRFKTSEPKIRPDGLD
jgi:hypothetical protein